MKISTKTNRRSFIKVSAAAGGGMVVGFSWLASCKNEAAEIISALPEPNEWFEMSGFVKIGDTGLVTIMSPNPEIGQNIKTSMPMIVAEELDVDWKNVVVEQAPLNTNLYERQVAGGSQSIRQGWISLRKAGATARHMLVEAAAKQWKVDVSELTVSNGIITNASGEELSYGELASEAANLTAPEEVELKNTSEFNIIGKSKTNVDIHGIVKGEALFGLDFKREGMLHAVMKRPPAFGNTLVNYDDRYAKAVNGVVDVVQIDDSIAVVAEDTWAAMKGQKALKAEYKSSEEQESSGEHSALLRETVQKNSEEALRNDGNVDKAFAECDQIIERIFEAPFLPHNPLEPMNFFADVRKDKVELIGPTQTPQWQQSRVAEQLERDPSEIEIQMTRMGGGFGRRLYGNFVTEAVAISDKLKKPIKLVYSREDDFASGPYRPASAYKFKAGIKDGELHAYHLIGAGFNTRNACRQDWFPAGTLEHYRIDSHNLETNIPTGAWRAPVTNFLASAEQSFFDEIAEAIEIDPVELRLSLLRKAKENLIGEIDYDIDKMIGVIELARDKSDWENKKDRLGFSAYYCHNTYVAEVAELSPKEDSFRVKKVTCAVDCGIVINPAAAINQIEGGIIDGIGHALFGNFGFENGAPKQLNFNGYHMIRMDETPEIDVHFVESDNDPTGLGEPTLPPAAAAVANAFYRLSGKRLYKQPFEEEMNILG